jgi:hypothetical protein
MDPYKPDLDRIMTLTDGIVFDINGYSYSKFVQFQIGDCKEGMFVPSQNYATYRDLNEYLTTKIVIVLKFLQ